MMRYITPLLVGLCVGFTAGYAVNPKPYNAIFAWVMGLLA